MPWSITKGQRQECPDSTESRTMFRAHVTKGAVVNADVPEGAEVRAHITEG